MTTVKKHQIKNSKCKTLYLNCGCGEMKMIGRVKEDNKIGATFSISKSGGCSNCQVEAISRLISIALDHGAPPEHIVEELKDLGCPSPFSGKVDGKDVIVKSCSDCVSQLLNIYLKLNKEK